MRRGSWFRGALWAYVALVVVFVLAPVAAIVTGSFTTSAYVTFPPQGLTLRWYLDITAHPEYLNSMLLSLIVAGASATAASVIVTIVAVAARQRARASRLLEVIALSPAMLPAIVLGIMFLQFYSRLRLGNSPISLVLGHIILVTPFAFSLVRISFGALDPNLERAARSLGASPVVTFRRITLPQVAWGLAAGWALAFMISFGDLAVSLFLASPGVTTLPVRIYNALEWSPLNPTLTAIASGLVLVTLVVLLVGVRLARLEQFFNEEGQ